MKRALIFLPLMLLVSSNIFCGRHGRPSAPATTLTTRTELIKQIIIDEKEPKLPTGLLGTDADIEYALNRKQAIEDIQKEKTSETRAEDPTRCSNRVKRAIRLTSRYGNNAGDTKEWPKILQSNIEDALSKLKDVTSTSKNNSWYVNAVLHITEVMRRTNTRTTSDDAEMLAKRILLMQRKEELDLVKLMEERQKIILALNASFDAIINSAEAKSEAIDTLRRLNSKRKDVRTLRGVTNALYKHQLCSQSETESTTPNKSDTNSNADA